MFRSRDVTLEKMELVGKDGAHLKLLLRGGDFRWPALFWNAADRTARLEAGKGLDIVFRLAKNFYRNEETLQLQLLDFTL